MNLKGEPAFVGRHCGSNEYTIDANTVRFYQDALGDEHPLHANFAPPLLYHSECYAFLGEWYLANLFGNLHGQQDWEFFSPIPIGSRIRSRSTIINRYSRRGRDWVVNETDLMSAMPGEEGKLLVRGRTYQSFLPPKESKRDGFVVDQQTALKKTPRPPFPTSEGPDLAAVEKRIDDRRCWMFSGPGKNYHTDRDEAKKLGFPSIVVQGMMSTCFVSEIMQASFGMGWLEGGKMSVKLTNVLWVDETITAHARVRDEAPEGPGASRVFCDVWVEKTDGSRVILGEASALRKA